MSLPVFAALAAALIFLALAIFNTALALGAPLGQYTLGGRHRGALPSNLRMVSAISVPIALAMGVIVLMGAGVLYPQLAPAMVWPVWGVFLFLVVNTFGNLASQSPEEKRVMGPLAALAAILVAVVAMA